MPRLTRAESKVRTRQRLLDSGERLFKRVGFHAASVEEIAEKAGFSRGAFYANFTDKSDLLLSIVEERDTTIWADMEGVLEQASTDEVLPAIQAWFERVALDPGLALAWAEMWPQAMRDPKLRRRLVERQAQTRTLVAGMVQRYCEAAGLDPPLPLERFAAMTIALGDGLAAQRRIEPSVLPPDLFVNGMAYLWLGAEAAGPGSLARSDGTPVPGAARAPRETPPG